MNAATMHCVSDGFMINLGGVLLNLCQPFCISPNDPKSLKIDPTYGAVPVSITTEYLIVQGIRGSLNKKINK